MSLPTSRRRDMRDVFHARAATMMRRERLDKYQRCSCVLFMTSTSDFVFNHRLTSVNNNNNNNNNNDNNNINNNNNNNINNNNNSNIKTIFKVL